MEDALQLKIDHLDELDIMELEQALQAEGFDTGKLLKVSKTPAPKGTFGVPADMNAVLQIAQIALPALIGVLALWVSKGRGSGKGKRTSFSWTKDGVQYERVELAKQTETDTSDQIASALSSGLAKAMKAKDAPKGGPVANKT